MSLFAFFSFQVHIYIYIYYIYPSVYFEIAKVLLLLFGIWSLTYVTQYHTYNIYYFLVHCVKLNYYGIFYSLIYNLKNMEYN